MELPEPFIVTDNKGLLTVEPRMKKRLDESQDQLVVVAVVGAYRTGKSFLLNQLMNKQDGFPLGATVQSKTKGIWAWLSRHPRSPERLLLLLDTEGLDDPEKADADHDVSIFSLALLLSSIFVYNSKGVIDNKALEELHLVSELTEHIRIKSGSKEEEEQKEKEEEEEEEEGKEFHAFFPHFIWAVRDFFLKCEVDGEEVTPTEYMEWHLRAKKGKNKHTMRANDIREALQHFFGERHCFLFPFPVVDQQRLWNLESLPGEELDAKFLEAGEAFTKHIFSQEASKSINGKAITGRMFLSLVETYVDTINSGAVPSVDTAVNQMAASENKKAKEAAVEVFENAIQGLKLPRPGVELEERLSEGKREALDLFLSRAMFDKNDEGRTSLERELTQLCRDWIIKNQSASTEASRDKLESLYAGIRSKIQEGFFLKSGGYNLYANEMAELKSKYLLSPNLGDEAEKVLTRFLSERGTEGKQIQAADVKMTEEGQALEEEKEKRELFEKENERQRYDLKRLEEQQAQMTRDHEGILERHKAEMQEKMEKEKEELEKKIVSENEHREEEMRKAHEEETARMEESLQLMQNDLAKKVS